jgi:hypothetical protein
MDAMKGSMGFVAIVHVMLPIASRTLSVRCTGSPLVHRFDRKERRMSGGIAIVVFALGVLAFCFQLIRRPVETMHWIARRLGGERGVKMVPTDPVRTREIAMALMVLPFLALGIWSVVVAS